MEAIRKYNLDNEDDRYQYNLDNNSNNMAMTICDLSDKMREKSLSYRANEFLKYWYHEYKPSYAALYMAYVTNAEMIKCDLNSFRDFFGIKDLSDNDLKQINIVIDFLIKMNVLKKDKEGNIEYIPQYGFENYSMFMIPLMAGAYKLSEDFYDILNDNHIDLEMLM